MPTGREFVQLLVEQVGDPYVWGATGPNAFDCSGLVQWGAKQFGITVPRVTYDQINSLLVVPDRDKMREGDLIFSHWGDQVRASHVAVYAGNNQIVEAPAPGKAVQVREIPESYWANVDGIRRIPGIGSAKGSTPPIETGRGGAPAPATGGDGDDGGKEWWEYIPSVAVFQWMFEDGPAAGTVRSGLDGIGDALRGVAVGLLQVGNVANMVTKMFLPNNILRGVFFAFGVAFIFIGIWFLAREVRQSQPA